MNTDTLEYTADTAARSSAPIASGSAGGALGVGAMTLAVSGSPFVLTQFTPAVIQLTVDDGGSLSVHHTESGTDYTLSPSPAAANSPMLELAYGVEELADGIYATTTETTYNEAGSPLVSVQKELISELSPTLESKNLTIDNRGLTSAEWTEYNGTTKRTHHQGSDPAYRYPSFGHPERRHLVHLRLGPHQEHQRALRFERLHTYRLQLHPLWRSNGRRQRC